MSTTPNMNLTLPVVGSTIGPDWASELNAALEDIDSHDHSSGKGVQIGTAGLNLNADLTINNFGLVSVDRLELVDQLAALTPQRSIYAVNGDLYYTNTAGDQVQITNGNSIAGIPGAITGLGDGGSSGVYYDVTDTLAFYYSGTSQAKFDIATVQIHPYDGASPYANYIALAVPTSIASSYTLTLPAAVASQSLPITVKNDGTVLYGADAGSAAAPSLAFAADLDTGFYNSGANVIAIATAGARIGYFNSTALNMNSGSVTAPTYTFDTDSNTGMYRSAADTLNFATNGTSQLAISTSAVVSALPIRGSAGSASSPSLSFSGDTNTGMYSSGADQIGFATGGTFRASISSSGVTSNPGFATSAADSIKWEVFTGTLSSGSSSVTLSEVGGNILGATGRYVGLSTGETGIIANSNSTANYVRFNTIVGNDELVFSRVGSSQSYTYRIVVYYQ